MRADCSDFGVGCANCSASTGCFAAHSGFVVPSAVNPNLVHNGGFEFASSYWSSDANLEFSVKFSCHFAAGINAGQAAAQYIYTSGPGFYTVDFQANGGSLVKVVIDGVPAFSGTAPIGAWKLFSHVVLDNVGFSASNSAVGEPNVCCFCH